MRIKILIAQSIKTLIFQLPFSFFSGHVKMWLTRWSNSSLRHVTVNGTFVMWSVNADTMAANSLKAQKFIEPLGNLLLSGEWKIGNKLTWKSDSINQFTRSIHCLTEYCSPLEFSKPILQCQRKLAERPIRALVFDAAELWWLMTQDCSDELVLLEGIELACSCNWHRVTFSRSACSTNSNVVSVQCA